MTAVINEPVVSKPVADLDVTTTQTELLAALTFVTKATKASSTQLQVLQGTLFEADNGVLTLSRFDYETVARQDINAIGSGRALIPTGTLSSFVKGMAKGCTVELRVERDTAVLSGDEVTYRIPLLPIEDYPELPDSDGVLVATLPAQQLARLNDVTVAAGGDDTLPVLTGVLFRADVFDELELASTDRYRLAVLQVGVPACLETPLLVPAKAVAFTVGAFKGEEVMLMHRSLGENGHQAIFIAGRRSLAIRTIDGTFPDYRRLLPSEHHLSVTVNVKALLKGVTQVALALSRTAPVILHTGLTEMTLSAGAAGAVTATKTVPATGSDVPVEIGANPGYLIDGMKATGGEEVVISFANEDPWEAARKPMLLSKPGDPQFRYLLMPVRLSGT